MRFGARRSVILRRWTPPPSVSRLSSVLDGAAITDLHRLSGGASRETWRFLADGRPTIVQRQRAGDQRDMLIEADVVRAAAVAGVPVPRTPRRRATTRRCRVHGARGDRGRDDRPQDPARRRLSHRAREPRRRHRAGHWRASTRIDPAPLTKLVEIDQVAHYTEALDNLGQPHPVLELVRNWLIDHRPATRSGRRRARRLPPRQPHRRRAPA